MLFFFQKNQEKIEYQYFMDIKGVLFDSRGEEYSRQEIKAAK